MAKYSELENPGAEEIVEFIIGEIASRFNPKSIILSGSFGRGEASIIEDNGRLLFMSDCEISIISNKSIPADSINKLSLELTEKTGLDLFIHANRRLSIYFLFPRLFRRLWRPSILHYDLKQGARAVFGKDLLVRLPTIEPGDIPLWEGIRLILNRMAESLGYFSVGHQDKEKYDLIYWTNKIVLACQDALLLSVNQYHHSYKTRNLLFQELVPGHFNELTQRMPGFLPLTMKATKYKLRPEKDTYAGDVTKLWFDVAEICDEVFRYIIEMDMNFTFDTYSEFKQKYLAHPNIKGKYHLGIISSPTYQNLRNIPKMILSDSYRSLPLKLMGNIRHPWQHIVYSLIPLVYFGLSRGGSVDQLLLKTARDTLSLFMKLKPEQKDPLQEWSYIKEQASQVWYTFCY